jgi:inner membrane protein
VASAFAHAAAGAALWPLFRTARLPRRAWAAGALCAVLPDADVLAFGLGVAYGDLFGHRGLTHSLAFATVLAWLVLAAAYPARRWPADRGRLWAYLALATASHGVLDAMTTGGLGVAFLAPLENDRYFFPWRPIAVSPIGVRPFFTARGLAVLANETLWVGVPAGLLAWGAARFRPVDGSRQQEE